MVLLAGWATPKVASGGYQLDDQGNQILNLQGQVQLAGWKTPMAPDARQNGDNEAGNSGQQPEDGGDVSMASDERGRTRVARNAHLDKQAKLSGWTTPRPTDDNMARRSPEAMERERNRPDAGSNLAIEAQLTAFGPGRLGTYSAPTGGRSSRPPAS